MWACNSTKHKKDLFFCLHFCGFHKCLCSHTLIIYINEFISQNKHEKGNIFAILTVRDCIQEQKILLLNLEFLKIHLEQCQCFERTIRIYEKRFTLLQVISLIGILTGMNSEHARVASLWFVLLDAIVLPQTLWLFNSRYRAAYRRIFNGLICRQPFFCSGGLEVSF